MTKTLTEQWREGKLPEDTYYVQFICGRYGVYEFEQYKGFGFDNDLAYIKEVLAPVPSYDEYKELVRKSDKLDKIMYDSATNQGDCQQIVEDNLNRQIKRLQEKLSIATKALKKYMTFCRHPAEEALKEMEGVK